MLLLQLNVPLAASPLLTLQYVPVYTAEDVMTALVDR